MRDFWKVLAGNLLAGAILIWWFTRKPAPAGSPAPPSPAGAGAAPAAPAASSYAGAAAPDYSALAAAILALARGVEVPNLVTVSQAVAAGTTELVAGIGGYRTCVLAYGVASSGANTIRFLAGGAEAWRVALDAPAGISGANLTTAYPSYLFAGGGAEAVAVETDGAAHVSITYWQEAV